MIITDIQVLSRTKVQIVIDDDIRYILPGSIVNSLGLFLNQELSEQEHKLIYQEYVQKPAKLKILQLLERRDYTEKELCDRLARQGFPKTAVSEALSYAAHYGYVDDLRYTRNYLAYKSSGKSRQMIYQTLLSKGVGSQTIRACMDEWESDEIENIRRLFVQKFGNIHDITPEKKQKILNYFLRKGYKYGDIANVIKDFDSI